MVRLIQERRAGRRAHQNRRSSLTDDVLAYRRPAGGAPVRRAAGKRNGHRRLRGSVICEQLREARRVVAARRRTGRRAWDHRCMLARRLVVKPAATFCCR